MNAFRIYVPVIAAYLGAIAVLACRSDGGTFHLGGHPYNDTGYPHGQEDSDTGPTLDSDSNGSDSVDSDSTSDTAAPFSGTGFEPGDYAYNLVASDQSGDPWRLYAHSGAPVVIVFGYAQDFNFQTMCGFLPALESEYASRGVTVVAFLSLDPFGVPADAAAATSWASTYGLSTVLWDSQGAVIDTWATATQVRTYVINSNMQINSVHSDYTGEKQLSDEIYALLFT